MTAGGGHIRDYEGIDKSKVPMTPLIAVNTTAGTASEMTRFCIITNTDTHVKWLLWTGVVLHLLRLMTRNL